MVAYIRTMAVVREKWLDDVTFKNGVSLCQAVPGATAMQMAAYVGLKVRELAGAIAAFAGFGTFSKLYTVINAADPREIIVMGFIETELEKALATARIDVRERLTNPLDDVIEPDIGRTFGILVSEDDFSASGTVQYKPPSIGGKEMDLKEVSHELSEFEKVVIQTSEERDCAREAKKGYGSPGRR
jgi:hypothetical protein